MRRSTGLSGRRTNPAVVWLAAAALFAAVFVVFGEVRSFGFLDYDDGDYILRNLHLREGSAIERLRWAFTAFHAANWHPLTWISFMVDGSLFGLDPGWYHVENLLLHGLNTVLLLGLLVRLTGSVGKSVLVATFFALHPLRAESVAWVTERKGLLMALFTFLALHAYVFYVRRRTLDRYLAVLILVAGALLAKPQAVALPLLLLILDWWPLGRIKEGAPPAAWAVVVREKAPLFLMAGILTVLTVAAQRQAGAVASLEGFPVGERLACAVVAPVAYLGKTLWPVRLAPAYPIVSPVSWEIAGAVLVLMGITTIAVRFRRTQPWLSAGWLGFLVLLAPVSNLFQTGGQALADRYTYLPHLLLFTGAVWSGVWFLRNTPRIRAAAAVVILVVAVALSVAACRQTGFWRDDLTLFSHAVAVTQGNWKMHYNLGNTFERLGREEEAEGQYRLALAARPAYPEALNNLGALHGRRGETGLAESLFNRAVSIQPGYGPGWFNLGFQSEQAGDLGGALKQYGRAAALQPDAAEPRIRMGRILARQGRREEAGASCREALRLDPGSAGAAACLREASHLPENDAR